MKKFFIGLALLAAVLRPARADEGMWLLPLLEKLNIADMRQLGCGLTAEQIYSINKSCIKDAVVIFGGGCTGEVVSPDGLLLTNHHCGYDAIREQSSVEHDYLQDGFWAKTRADELPAPDLSVTFLVRMEDVTASIDSVLTPGMSEEARNDSIDNKQLQIVRRAMAGNDYRARVTDFFGGNRFYLIVTEEYNDVRLVGAPPSSIGKFGYDTDNWMWPRHTCDFSMFRIYADSTGRPADYSTKNIPLKPRHYLPVSLKGVEENDFAMILGYPGSTERYSTSFEVQDMVTNELPVRVKLRGEKQEIMMRHMEANQAVRIKYASKYTRSSNYWKNSIGMIRGVEKMDVINRKKEQEKQFNAWLAADTARKSLYGEALTLLEEGTRRNSTYNKLSQYISECFLSGTELVRMGLRARSLVEELSKDMPDPSKVRFFSELLRAGSRDFFKDYDRALDEEVTEAMLKRYYLDIAPEYHPSFYKTVEKKYKGDFHRYTQVWFKSVLADSARLEAFLKKPSAKVLLKDPVYITATSVRDAFSEWIGQTETGDEMLVKGTRLYLAGLMAMQPNKKWYPDANFTMRLTYGSVKDYIPRDAVLYDYYTTLKGVMEKEIPGDREFSVPQKLKDLYKARDYGRYANAKGEMPVCFITNNDITGGNSGSPVINKRGELLGLAFDGNWEAMSGDIVFEPDVQRTIAVDIRYVLFIIDKFAGAKHLLDEMTIIQ